MEGTFKALFHHLFGRTEENHEKPKSGSPVSDVNLGPPECLMSPPAILT
jgi:hypothetical protein